MRRGVQAVGSIACGVSVEALGEGFFAAAFRAAGLWCSLGARWLEAVGMWCVACFLGRVWCVSLRDRGRGLGALGLGVWC